MHGVPFNWIHQRNEKKDQQLKVIECVYGERVEQQLEFELNRQLFRFDNRSLNSNQRYLCQSKRNRCSFFLVKKAPTAIEDYTIVNETAEGNQDAIQNSIGIQLLKRDNEKTDIVRFNVVYTPKKFLT